jgi:hypothetical protein
MLTIQCICEQILIFHTPRYICIWVFNITLFPIDNIPQLNNRFSRPTPTQSAATSKTRDLLRDIGRIMTQEYSSIPDLNEYDPEKLKMGMDAGKDYMKSKL